MKRYWIIMALFLSLGACKQSSDPNVTCYLSGSISPVVNDYLVFTYSSFLDSVKIDQEGNFEFEVPVEESGQGILMYNNSLAKVYLEANKKLEINISLSTFPDKIDFGGELGPMNHYLQLARKLDKQSDLGSDALYSMEPEPFKSFTDSIRQVKSKLLSEYIEKYQDMDAAFVRKKKADILYTWASQQLLYPGYYILVKNQIPPLPDNYHMQYMEELELNNDELMLSPVYKTFLENYLDYKEAVYLDNNPKVQKLWFPESVSRFRVINEEFSNQEIKDFLLYRSMNDHLDNYGLEHIETFITNFRVSCANEEYISLIEEKYTQNEKLARGEPAPELEFFNKQGEKVKLSDLKGKLLYINFWASWSDWSIQEFAYWEKLRKDFDGFEVDFISVSMDFTNDKNKWEYIVEKQKLGGLHLIQNSKSSAFKDIYFIDDLPRYFLIDKEGKIISTHAPRPSENMVEVLNNLLNE